MSLCVVVFQLLFIGTRLLFSFTCHSFHTILYVAVAKVFDLKLFFEKIGKKRCRC